MPTKPNPLEIRRQQLRTKQGNLSTRSREESAKRILFFCDNNEELARSLTHLLPAHLCADRLTALIDCPNYEASSDTEKGVALDETERLLNNFEKSLDTFDIELGEIRQVIVDPTAQVAHFLPTSTSA